MVGPVPTSSNIFAVMFPEMMLLFFAYYFKTSLTTQHFIEVPVSSKEIFVC